MKFVVIMFFACIEIVLSATNDVILKSGRKISGEIVSIVPATIQVKIAAGGIITFPVSDLDGSTIRKLPKSVSASYIQLYETEDMVDRQMKLLERCKTELEKFQSATSNAIGQAYNLGRTHARNATARGVPADVHEQIRRKAQDKWPNDFAMQKYEIDEQEKAWLQVNR